MGYMIMAFLVMVFLICVLALYNAAEKAIRRGDETAQLPHVYYLTADTPMASLPMEGMTYYMRERYKPQYMPELDMMVFGVAVYDRELSMQDVHRLGLVRKPKEE